MIRHILTLALLGLVACGGSGGGDDDGPTPDGPVNVPQTIMISGTAVEVTASGSEPLAGVLVEAFANSDENTVITMATTDAQGNYTLTVETDGNALDGFLKATANGVLVTYLYPPEPLAENFDGASINMISSNTLGLLTMPLFCDEDQGPNNGLIAVLVYDSNDMPVAGAELSSSPAPSSICYNGSNDLPDGDATVTAADGIGYMFNVAGAATVSATAPGLTLRSHDLTARAGALTTTLIRP